MQVSLDAPLGRLQAQLLQPRHLRTMQHVRGDIGEWRAPPQPQRLRQPIGCPRPDAGADVRAARAAQRLEPPEVHLGLIGDDQIARTAGSDPGP